MTERVPMSSEAVLSFWRTRDPKIPTWAAVRMGQECERWTLYLAEVFDAGITNKASAFSPGLTFIRARVDFHADPSRVLFLGPLDRLGGRHDEVYGMIQSESRPNLTRDT